ncbi:MAG: peptidase T [Pirellulales bacterium]|nr:peptidase T [Planctomycetales bacterium]
MNSERLLERFLRYVRIDTTAVDDAGRYPSSPGQLELGKLLADELRAIGAADVVHTDHGIVLASIPASVGRECPTVALCAHLDTSPETTGKDVRPQVIRRYPGGDIELPGAADRVIRVAENPELDDLIGATLITTDGTTLLGGDDKAGVAVIMETAQWLLEHPELPHGRLRICFTCDEEIGRGVDHVDLGELAADVCYTLDGQGADELDVETFSADMAVVTFRGVNIHPAIAKDRMVNALRVAGDFLSRLPRELSPEMTDERDGFVHPYVIEGGVAKVTVKVLLRDFDTARLDDHAAVVRRAAAGAVAEWPGASVDVDVRHQYRNMADGLVKEPRATALAEAAMQLAGGTPRQTIIRGGTDGSRLTELGLPTPNISTGQHTLHSPLEWACLDEMLHAGEVVKHLCALWSDEPIRG